MFKTCGSIPILLCATAIIQAADRKPNVLIIFPDQLRWCELGCYGNKVIRSPNIDRLALGGVLFTQGFTNFPICSPARSVLLSGRYACSNGLFSNQDNEAQPGRPTNRDTTIAEVLSNSGYATGLVGKWHLRPTPQTLGFAESLRTYFRHRYFKQIFSINEDELYEYDGYAPDNETDAAIAFIRKHREHPFFLYLAYGPPHMPVSEVPEKYRTMYDPAKVVLRDNVWKDGKLAYDENWFKTYMWDFQYYNHKGEFKHELPPGMNLRDLTALYYGQITAVDDCIGRVLAALKDAELEEDTIVVLSSDHGDLLGSHQEFNKNLHYDEAVRIPMIFRYPRRIKPRAIEMQVAATVDIMPSLLELCGAKIPASVQGTSLVPVLTGDQSTVGENAAFIETTQCDGIRTLRYMYNLDRKTDRREQLFDVDRDSNEMNNLANDQDHRELRNTLRDRVHAWRKTNAAGGTNAKLIKPRDCSP